MDFNRGKKLYNLKQCSLGFLIGAIMCFLAMFLAPPLVLFGVICLIVSFILYKKYKKLLNEAVTPNAAPIVKSNPEPVDEPVVEVETDKVKITELNGNVIKVDSGLMLDDDNIVLTTPNSKKYHTHVGCFKNWRPEMQSDFKGWTVMKKDDAIKKGMSYCKFCEENDNITLDDIEDMLDDEEL